MQHAHADATGTSAADPSVGRSVLDAPDIARVVTRISHEILERDTDPAELVILGIPTRGAVLAQRLAASISTFESQPVAVGALDITLYRDDLRLRAPRALETTSIPDRGIDDAVVVLVDDVLFSGRTVRAALDALQELGRPRAVRLAVLVDRGHRQLPIRADYVGKNIPTSLQESVHVRLAETDGVDEVVLGGASASRPGQAPSTDVSTDVSMDVSTDASIGTSIEESR